MTYQASTFGGYQRVVKNAIIPHFENVLLNEVNVALLQAFYDKEMRRGLTVETIRRYQANIHKALKLAVAQGLIQTNPADFITLPKSEDMFKASYYTQQEIKQLASMIEGHLLEVPVILAAYYGLRRSEVLGLRWSQVDFENNIIMINFKVTGATTDGRYKTISSERLKSASSNRSFPLIPTVKDTLIKAKERIQENRLDFGNGYDNRYLDYVCVDSLGKRILPDRLTRSFPAFLEGKGMRKIRFHDLRHSCATLLISNGIPIHEVKEWLGHSSLQMTLRYTHQDHTRNANAANVIGNILG